METNRLALTRFINVSFVVGHEREGSLFNISCRFCEYRFYFDVDMRNVIYSIKEMASIYHLCALFVGDSVKLWPRRISR
jgi:hypothetical protein